ncbi:DUF3043 domain-containing protein [Corynebacterium nuruki]|jgi:hypothetical protein|uniref:DUF3043 domain-containing protein n=1 Tax=Corynebacterium nuruki TaxID=1032851 RepID=UPI0002485E9B|nr:DUF3043 domain-containing protein [Corynebacterium nuruki]MDN6439541.1 DUF3043 domain-containing protein [Corynebacterium nuruki]
MPWKKDDETGGDPADRTGTAGTATDDAATDTDGAAAEGPKGYTPKKGRPTPKRNEVERAAGTRRAHYEAPLTPKEARQRRKDVKNSMTKEEFKEAKRKQREEATAARRKANDRMMAGDPDYLLARDQGKEKLLIRNWVDAHRYAMNFFLPLALVVIVIMIVGTRLPEVASLTSIIMMVIILALIVEGFFLGRKVNKVVRARYPGTSLGRWTIGFYAFTRATMIRRMRSPAPQVAIGDEV